MARELRLYLLAIGLPALLIAAGGIALLRGEWTRAQTAGRPPRAPALALAPPRPPPHQGLDVLHEPPPPPPDHRRGDAPPPPPRAEDAAALRRRAARLLAVGGCLLALLVSTLFAGGALLVRAVRRERREALDKASFVDNVSHELKTPLAGIRLCAELLVERRVTDAPRRDRLLRTILTESDRLTRIVGNLLDAGRLARGARTYRMETLDLAACARAVVADAATHPGGDRLAPPAADAPPVWARADGDAVRQIALNLLDNALKYTPGPVEVSVGRRADGRAVLAVADYGPGVPRGAEARIFERFYRGDESLTRRVDGSGLGLNIARGLARGMGGDVTYSPRDGGGSVFALALPAAPPPPEEAPA